MKLSVLNLLFIFSLASLFAGTLLFPIFTDEIGYFILRNRLALDGVHIILHPQCGRTNFEWQPPFAWYPISLMRSLAGLLIENPLQVRIIGIIKMFINLGLLLFCSSKIAILRKDKLFNPYGIICLLGSLGPLIWIMSINRPEQSLLMGFLGILSIVLIRIEKPSLSIGMDLRAVFGICLASILLFSSHIKAFGFIPFTLLALIFSSRSWKITAIGLLISIWIFASSTYSFIALTGCSEDKYLTSVYEQWVLNPLKLIHDPEIFLQKAFYNLKNFSLYIYGILIYSSAPIEWIKTSEVFISKLFLKIINPIWVILLSIIAVEMFWGTLRSDEKKNRIYLLGISSLIGLLSIATFQTYKLFYESSFYLPILIVSWGMLRSHIFPILIEQIHIRFNVLQKLTIASVFALVVSCIQPVLTSINSNLHVKHGYYWFEYFRRKSNIYDSAELCKIDPYSENTHLVVDDLTYFAFPKLAKPFHVFYIGDPWGQGIKGNLQDFLVSWKSSGIIARCDYIPEELREYSIEGIDGICCIGKSIFNISEDAR